MAKLPAYTVLQPNLGLVLDRPPEAVPPQGLLLGSNNFRIYKGNISTYGLGRTKFLANPLNGPVALISEFYLSTGSAILILGTLTDLYLYNGGSPLYLTPAYVTGTASVDSSGNVTGTGTAWNTSIGSGSPRKNVRVGDYLGFGGNNLNAPWGTWWKVSAVIDDTHLTLANYTGGARSAGQYTIRQCFAGTLDNPFATEEFPNADNSLGAPIGDLWFATNGVDPVITWNGTDTFATYHPELGFTCRSIYRYKDMMLYLGLTENSGTDIPAEMANSDAGEPLSMSTGVAAQEIVSDGPYPILAAKRLFDNLVIYNRGEVILGTYLGPPLGFAFRSVIQGRGPIGPNLIADFGYYHKFIGNEGEWLFNGISTEVVGTQVYRNVMASYDPSRINRGFAHFDQQMGELIWAIPLTSDVAQQGPERAYVEHYLERNLPPGWTTYSQRDFVVTAHGYYVNPGAGAATWSQATGPWNTATVSWVSNLSAGQIPINLVGDASGYIYQLNSGDTTATGSSSAGYACTVIFPPRAAIDGRHSGLVRRIYPFAQLANYPLTVTVQVYDRVGGAPLRTTTVSYDMTQAGLRFVNPFAIGKLFQVTFSTPGPSQPFVLEGYDADVVPGGQR